jgi:hypothetical protein
MTRLILVVTPNLTLRSIDPACTNEITSLGPDDVVYFVDNFSRNWLDNVIGRYGAPGMVLCDAEGTAKSLPVPYCFSATYAFESQLLGMRGYEFTDTPVTECFNFSIAKQRPERHLLLKLIEWFELNSYRYSWSEFQRYFNMEHFLEEMTRIDQPWVTNELKIHMLHPVRDFEKRWVQNNENAENFHPIFVGGTIKWLWENVQQNLVPQTAVTMITESGTDFEDNYTFTEKTGFAVMGLTFPIWVGSYKQAEQAERMGFDIFADVINHDYQHCATMFERCYRAVADNLCILTDLALAQRLKQQHYTRLVNNRNYLLNGGVSEWIDQQIATLPPAVADYMQTSYHRKVK